MNQNVRMSLAIGVMVLSPFTARAQTGSVSVVAAATSHRLMEDPLAGVSALVALPLGSGGRSLRLQAEHVSGNAHRTGIACGGFILEPELCPEEPVVDDARMTTLAVGLGFPLLQRAGFTVGLTVDARLGNVSADTRGLDSGNRIGARKSLWGADVGLQGSWVPFARLPVALEGALALGGLRPPISEEVLDGYTPFNNGFIVRRARLGIAWRGARR